MYWLCKNQIAILKKFTLLNKHDILASCINVMRIFDTADLSSRASLGPSPMNKFPEAFECFN